MYVCVQQTVTSLQPFATARMLLHVQHPVANGCKEVTFCCIHTDVVVLAVATFQQLGLETLWIGFGRNKNFR